MGFLGISDEGMSLTEAADQLGVSRNSLKKRCDRGTIDYYKGSDGARRIPQDVIDNFGVRTIDELPYNPYDYSPKFDIPPAELWGSGKAPVVKPSTKEHWETVVFASDFHVPYHDTVLVDAWLDMLADIKPHRVVLNGDINDFFNLSRFNAASERLELLQSEINQGKMIRQQVRVICPDAVIDETIGNHEERLMTYPGFNAPALRSLDSLKPANLLGLNDLEITHWPANGFRLREDFVVEHGVVVRSQSGASAKARLETTLISGIMGHTHRLDSFRKSGYRHLSWYEQGCMCMLNPDYVKGGANWTQGFAVGMFSTKTSNFNVQLIPAVGRGFVYDGKHYGETNNEADIWTGPLPNFESKIENDQYVKELITMERGTLIGA